MSRKKDQLYPDFSDYMKKLDDEGISIGLLQDIIKKHEKNRDYNEKLYERYMALDGSVPIFNRNPRFAESDPINNKVNNDFFSEIVDFKTGYFAGSPIGYSYSNSDEAEEGVGGELGVDNASKVLTDFTTRNNMYGVDMEITKFASIYGYAGRLFFIDPEGAERVMAVHGYETIVLSEISISEPKYAIRYFSTKDTEDNTVWNVEFYDNQYVYSYTGKTLSSLEAGEVVEHMFDHCPLQGIANNKEMLGDAEKVLGLIDDYDKVLSDNSNEVEAFVHAYLIFEGIRIDDDTIKEGQKSGSFNFPAMGTQQGRAYFLTKNINDAFTEHHLKRLEDNIYRFSKTPNLNDDTFNSASGIALKFKLHGLETKCGMFEAKMMDAAQYMFKVLASAWTKKGVAFDPLQVVMDFSRNFPLDLASEAAAVQALIGAGLPKQVAYAQLSFVDDVNYVLDLIEAEKQEAGSLFGSESGGRLYKYQISMIQEYADKIKSGEMTEERAISLLRHTVELPNEEIRNLLDLGDSQAAEEKMEDVLEEARLKI